MSRLSSSPACVAAVLLLAGTEALAATPAQLEPITVTARRAPQPVTQALGDVTVISREQLAQGAYRSVAEALAQAPGVEYSRTGGPQSITSVFLRGANANQLLVLIDGQRVNSATTGGAAWQALAVDQIERIEILRGNASSLYGADAIGGVIQIITRQPTEDTLALDATVGVGSRGAQLARAGVSGTHADWRYAVQAGYEHRKGHDDTTDALFVHNPDRDSSYRRHVTAMAGWRWADGQDLSLNVYNTRVNGGYDSGQPYFNDRSIQTLSGFNLTSRNAITERWTSTLRLGNSVDNVKTENAPAALAFGNTEDGVSRFRTRQFQATWQNDLTLAPGQQLSLVLESLTQRVNGDVADWSTGMPVYGDYPVRRENTRSAAVIYSGELGAHQWQASVRRDRHDTYGGQTTGSAAYAYRLTEHLRLRLGANTGFRAPTFNDLYFPGGGNPDLQPEKSRNVEAGLQYTRESWSVGATAYHNRVRNLITGWPTVNVGRAVLRGVTLEGGWQHDGTRLDASLDLQDPHDADTGARLPLRARQILRVGAWQRIGAAELGAQWRLTGERYTSTNLATRQRLAGYGRLDLILGYDINPATRVQLRWDNVFNRDYVLAHGYRADPRQVMLTLTYQPRW